jgi:hypothetical protein
MRPKLARSRQRVRTLASQLIERPAATPSLALLAGHTAQVLESTAGAISGLILLGDEPARSIRSSDRFRLPVADWLPVFISGMRATVAVGTVELWWIATAWPGGAGALAVAAIAVTLLEALREEAEPIAIPQKHLHTIASPAAKYKKLTRKRIFGELGLHEARETIEPVAQIRETAREPYACAVG